MSGQGSCQLIITADDLGYSEGRNRGIVQGYEQGVIQRASLMVNGVQAQDAVRRAKQCGLPLGLHFNISEGRPVLPTKDVSTLLTPQGFFLDKAALCEAMEAQRVDTSQVKEELRAQIARFRDLVGETPLYIDGHQHLHIVPGLTETFASCLAEAGVFETRVPIQLDVENHSWMEDWLLKFLIKTVAHARLATSVFTQHGIRWSDYYFGLSTMGTDMTLERLNDAFQLVVQQHQNSRHPDQSFTCELMTHPGIPTSLTQETHQHKHLIAGCGEGPDDFEQDAGRRHELNLLTSSPFRQQLTANNVVLVKSCI